MAGTTGAECQTLELSEVVTGLGVAKPRRLARKHGTKNLKTRPEPLNDDVIDLPDCRTCGACCFSELATYVRVWGDDHARLGDAVVWLTRWDTNRCYLRMVDGHCAALVLDSEGARFLCSVYQRRPDTCRELERGSAACRAERAAKAAQARARLGAEFDRCS